MAPRTVSVTVKYSKPGTQPPIYLGGSFAEPQWQHPREMQYSTDENNEYEFFTEVKVEEGKEYQYKFRVGEGDWWILNEDSPTVTDDSGFRNNLLAVPVAEETDNIIEARPAAGNPPVEESTPTRDMEHSTQEHAEEAMGTRETSDVLFNDEIVKDIEEEKEAHTPITPEPVEPHSTPATELWKAKVEHVQELKDIKDDPEIAHSVNSIEPVGAAAPEIALTEPEPESIPTPAFDIEKPHTEHFEENGVKEALEHSQASFPIVVLDKVDSEPSYGDDFGPEATTSQKDAHKLRTQDAEPDQTIIRNGAHTPEVADVAAEVADSAATLDREAPTPPISDEEAGRIGFRRMSNTPIPEVADTAAEVADVAAIIDGHTPLTKKELGDLLEARGYVAVMNDMSIEFPETPPNEKVPLFPHECAGPVDHTEPCRHELVDPLARRPSRYEEPTVFDPNDPTIKKFPEDREGILRHLAMMQARLPPDTADCVGGKDSYISEEIHAPGKNVNAIPHQERSPSLDSIAEENDEEQESLASAAKANGDRGLTDLSKLEKAEVKLEDSSKAEKDSNSAEPAIPEKGENAKPKPVASENGSATEVPTVSVKDSESFLTKHIDQSLDGAEATSGRKSPSQDISLPVSPGRIPVTPIAVGSPPLGQADEDIQATAIPAGPSIHVKPATPSGSTADPEPLEQPVDTAKTTAFEDKNSTTKLKSRKQPPSPIPERPLTPSSMRSAGKDAESRNFLKAFWRVFFVEWIGGLIMRLCGGRDRRT